jgi:uncharacterized membrane protein
VGKLSTADRYHCPAGLDFSLRAAGANAVDLMLSEHIRRLSREPSASVEKFSDGQVSVWERGWGALLEIGDRRYWCWETRAETSAQDGQELGVQFRAVGTASENGEWILEFYKDGMSFTDQTYGRAFVPPASAERIDGASIYVSTSEAHRLQVVIEQRECIGFHGARFHTSVEVNLDGDGYSGCGYVP